MIEIAFLIPVYQDQRLAERLIRQVRNFYPSAPILSLSDGVEDLEYAEFCAGQNVQYSLSPRLKLMDLGAAWVKRNLIALDSVGAQVCIKLDPDSQMHRPFQQLPPADYFGSVNCNNFQYSYCRGGCVGFSHRYIQAVLQSGLLDEDIFKSPPYGYQRYGAFRWPWEKQASEMVLHEDFILGYAAHILHTPPTPWPEVQINFREDIPSPSDFAVTHPHPRL